MYISYPNGMTQTTYATPIRQLVKDQSHEISSTSTKLETMQEKYRDIYPPTVPYNKANLDKADALISEKYPFHENVTERTYGAFAIYDEDGNEKITFNNDITLTKKVSQNLEDTVIKKYEIYKKLDEKTKEEYRQYVDEINAKYPSSDTPPDEAARFLEAATYEGLEQGMSLEKARDMAHKSLSRAMPDYITNLIKNWVQSLGEDYDDGTEYSKNSSNPYGASNVIFTYANEEVQKYGLQNKHYIKHDDNYLAKAILNQIKTYEFLLDNPDIYKQIHEKHPFDPNDEENNQKSIKRNYQELGYKFLPMAKIAQKVFENYNIYGNSLDMSA